MPGIITYMRAIVGLDPSSKKIAIAVSIDGKYPKLYVKSLKSKDIAEVCSVAYRYVWRFVSMLREQDIEVFMYIEEPVVGRGGVYSTLRQTKANGAMLAGAVNAGAHVKGVNNQSWKKVVVGNGNAGKPKIEAYLAKANPELHMETNGDQDLMDALCIMKYGQLHIDDNIPVTGSAKKKPATRTRR